MYCKLCYYLQLGKETKIFFVKVGASRSMESICLISISEPADSASETVYNSSRDSINEIEELE